MGIGFEGHTSRRLDAITDQPRWRWIHQGRERVRGESVGLGRNFEHQMSNLVIWLGVHDLT